MHKIAPEFLALQRLYHWEKTTPQRVALTQPMGGDAVQDFTWAQVADQSRRMAAYLQAQGWAPGSKVAILSKNCAWWMMSDLAIWMAGYVSVPLYPTLAPETITQILTHSESQACFIGKLDGWEHMKPGVPAGLPCISYPLSPDDARSAYEGWDAIVARTAPMGASPTRAEDDLATLIYTSGTTGMPKGVMHSFGNFAWALDRRRAAHPADRRTTACCPTCRWPMWSSACWSNTAGCAPACTCTFAESLDTFAADLQRARPTIFFSVPRLWVKFQQGIHHKMPPAKLNRLLGIPILGGIVRKKVKKALGWTSASSPPAAPPPCRWHCCSGTASSACHQRRLRHDREPGALPHHRTRQEPARHGGPHLRRRVQHRLDPQTGEMQMLSQALMSGLLQGAREKPRVRSPKTAGSKPATRADRRPRAAAHHRPGEGSVQDRQGQIRGARAHRRQTGDARGRGSLCGDRRQPGSAAGHCHAGRGSGGPRERRCRGTIRARNLPAAHLKGINATLDPHEQLQCIVVVTTAWTVDNDVITPTFKVKRNRIEDLYARHYEAWEASGKKVIWQKD